MKTYSWSTRKIQVVEQETADAHSLEIHNRDGLVPIACFVPRFRSSWSWVCVKHRSIDTPLLLFSQHIRVWLCPLRRSSAINETHYTNENFILFTRRTFIPKREFKKWIRICKWQWKCKAPWIGTKLFHDICWMMTMCLTNYLTI